MPLNLDDNKKPYFKQLGLDETFDEIQNYVNALPSNPLYSETLLTSSQIITLDSGITLLPAPGVNKYYDIEKVILEHTGDEINYYSTSNNYISISANYSNIILFDQDIIRNVYFTSPSVVALGYPTSTIQSNDTTSNLNAPIYTNTPIVIYSPNPITLADGPGNPLRVKIWYTIKTIGTEI